ncbi:MAG: exodeoxyribonuclease VII large subunit [Prevotella sp.]|nr:exodeoxyribonuclease VII large subunit [Prevotella sp.]MDY2633113.1 exodeoxyribonuclease VII large subunit [Prevotella sp.]
MRKSVTLHELNSLVKDTIEAYLPEAYWVEAELSDARESAGHCYMELIQKDLFTNTPVAKASARCWRNVWSELKPRFERVAGIKPASGMKVMLLVQARFHENYGFSWMVLDMDPTFTVGDMARKRADIIRCLKEQGVFDLNRELILSPTARRIAVISSENAAGYGDFSKQLADNPYRLNFITRLFPAVMQGESVGKSIVAALNDIYGQAADFDCVVIIRGGGATSDLSGFDSLELAENVANFPLPVITGIGHDRDESVLDLIAYRPVKTPTAAATFLVDHLKRTLDHVVGLEQRISRTVSMRLEIEKARIEKLTALVPRLFSFVRLREENKLERHEKALSHAIALRLQNAANRLTRLSVRIRPLATTLLLKENHRLQMLTQRLRPLDPQVMLGRGYSITMKGGKAVRSANELRRGDEIETRLEKGTIKSIIP